MIVSIDLTQTGFVVGLVQPDDFKGFKVVTHGVRPSELAEALASVGRPTGDGDAFIDVCAVKRLAGDRRRRPEWRESFEAMLDHARSAGWISADGDAIRAHCEID